MNRGIVSGTKVKQLSFLEKFKLWKALRGPIEDSAVPAVKEAKEELVLAGKKVVDKLEPSADSLIKHVPQDTTNVVRPNGKVRIPDVVAQRKADSLDTALISLDKNTEQIDSSKTITLQEAIEKYSSKSDSIRPKGKVRIPDVVANRKNYDIGTASK